jgi:hypothetical protein
MGYRVIQSVGIVWTCLLSFLIILLYATEPKSVRDVATQASVVTGTYQIDQARFDAARALFLREQYAAARDEWGRADPARRDARTQFYIAYSFYRQGWHRTFRDDELYRQGVAAVDRAISLAPGGRLTVDDETLVMRTADELRAELEAGLSRTLSDFNPLRVLDTRK